MDELLNLPTTDLTIKVVDLLGEPLTAVGCGITSAATLREWSIGTQEPDAAIRHRLRMLYQVGTSIKDQYGSSEVAQAWLIGNNPALDGEPLVIIAHSTPEEQVDITQHEVLLALRSFLQ